MTEQDKNHLLEMYKLHAELADNISQRREGANRLYVGILTAFWTAIVFMAKQGISDSSSILLFFGGCMGFGVCVSWYLVIRSYRQLNSGKFKTLLELEDKLPFQFFRREWEILEKGRNWKKYLELTVAERSLFFVFGIGYLCLCIYSLNNLLCRCN